MNLREWALPVYTVLIELSSGALFALWILRTLTGSRIDEKNLDEMTKIPILIIFSTIIAAMAGAHLHLSRPYLSFLAVLNFQHSWLSREITFNVFFFLLTGSLTALVWFVPEHYKLKQWLGWAAILAGFSTIYCMAHIYLLPTQIAWNSTKTFLSYYAGMLLLGSVSLITILLMDLNFSFKNNQERSDFHVQFVRDAFIWLTRVTVMTSIMLMLLNAYQFDFLQRLQDPTAQTSLNLLLSIYLPLVILQIGFLLLGVIWLVLTLRRTMKENGSIRKLLSPVYIANTLILIAAIIERFLFYATHVRIGI